MRFVKEIEREKSVEGWCLGPNEQREPHDSVKQ